MAAKDADLATDYVSRSLYLVDQDIAHFEVLNFPAFTQLGQPPEIFLVELGIGGGGTGGPSYRMRAHDTTLARYVFWSSSTVDDTGANYAGPGPLTDIVVQAVIGAV